jgi:hypothetical protein
MFIVYSLNHINYPAHPNGEEAGDMIGTIILWHANMCIVMNIWNAPMFIQIVSE